MVAALGHDESVLECDDGALLESELDRFESEWRAYERLKLSWAAILVSAVVLPLALLPLLDVSAGSIFELAAAAGFLGSNALAMLVSARAASDGEISRQSKWLQAQFERVRALMERMDRFLEP